MEDPTVGFLRDKKGSCSTRRGQRIDSGFWKFLQTPRGRIFSYLVYFWPKGFIMVGVACGRPCKLVPSLGTKGYGFHDRFSDYGS